MVAHDTMARPLPLLREFRMTTLPTEIAATQTPAGTAANPRWSRWRVRLAIALGLTLLAGGYFNWTLIDARRTDAVIGLLTSHGSLQVQRQPWHRGQAYCRTPLGRGADGQFTRPPKPLWLDFIDRYAPQFLIPTRLVCNQFIIDDEDRTALRQLGKVNSRLNGIPTLYVRTDKATDEEFHSLKELQRLQSLILRGSSISDNSLQYISGLRQLKTLDLSDTSITDAGLKRLRGLVSLEILELNSTKITDSGLDFLTDMSLLKRLSLEETQMTNAGMQKLRAKNPMLSIIVP